MQKAFSPPEMAELELALERTRRAPAWRSLLLMFWGAIMAKCLIGQWLLLQNSTVAGVKYNTTALSLVVLWIPSFLVSSVITVYFARRFFRELPALPLSGRLIGATWVACAGTFVVLAGGAVAYARFSVFLLPALAAALLGAGCYIQSVAGHRGLCRTLAAGWWLTALWLFAHPDASALAWMALGLIVLQVAPAAWLYWGGRRTETG